MIPENTYKIIDQYEPMELDAEKLIEILVKEGIEVNKTEFEEILDNYYQGIGGDFNV